MNLKEAYKILGLVEGASPEDSKKQYRKLTKEFHPDINKEPGAEDKFKKINEAYQVVSSGKSTDREDIPRQHVRNPFNPFSSGFNPFGQQSTVHAAHNIDLHTTISFKESVLGCKKDIKFHRHAKCVECNGNGESAVNNGCEKCGGKGQVTRQQGNMIFITNCDKCHGNTRKQSCPKCQSKGILDAETSISVTIPGGVQNGNALRMNGMGNFVAAFGPIDQYTDAHLYVHVTPEPGLRLDGSDVVSNLSISLLEALSGCTKTVNTVLGTKDVDIKSQSKNKDELLIPKLGVNGSGNHKVILDVQYPNEVDDLITFLSK